MYFKNIYFYNLKIYGTVKFFLPVSDNWAHVLYKEDANLQVCIFFVSSQGIRRLLKYKSLVTFFSMHIKSYDLLIKRLKLMLYISSSFFFLNIKSKAT